LAALDVVTLRSCRGEGGGEGDWVWGAGGREGGKEGCEVVWDGYAVQLLVCTVLGFVWLLTFRPVLLRLQRLKGEAWCLEEGREEGRQGGRGGTGSGKRREGRGVAALQKHGSADDEEKVVGAAGKIQ
jgi:hypothetical protein